jgi:SAM-dependent methyltransferase
VPSVLLRRVAPRPGICDAVLDGREHRNDDKRTHRRRGGPMAGQKLDTRAVGLDVGLSFIRWLTGAEHLHYGIWSGLDVTAGNLRAAQDAYSNRLFAHLPDRPGLRILDIGGGAGETAAKLIALGHKVEIVVPSAFLAARCRTNAPQAQVHECMFQDYRGNGPFDLCLFSESFQYIPLKDGLSRALALLAPGGEILVGDCFRSEAFRGGPLKATVGGGHRLQAFRDLVAGLPLDLVAEEDVSAAVAPSIDLEQAFFHVIGHAVNRVDGEMVAKKPARWRVLRWVFDRITGTRQRARLAQRLFENTRTSEMFLANNHYMFLRLRLRDL